MNNMTLPSRHGSRNSSPGSPRPSTLFVTEAPHIIESLRVSEKETFVSLKLVGQSGARTRDLRLSKQAASARAPAL